MTIVINLVVFVYMSMCVRVYSEGCKSLNVGVDTECVPTDCSQNRRFPGDANFSCTIHRRQGWDKFNRVRGPFTSIINTSIALYPPIITYIEWYPREFQGHSFPALRFNFTIPYRIKENGNYSTHFLVKAVRMIWSGIQNENSIYDDLTYSTSEKYKDGYYRLFDFQHYEGTSQDKTQPRMIQYDCITGLDTCNSNQKFYILELSAIAFQPQPFIFSLDYYVTTFNQQGDRWQPAIVTAIYSNVCSIYVVFEQAPNNYNITGYYLNLNYVIKGMNMRTEYKMADDKYSHIFPNLFSNLYEVEVLAVGGAICINTTCKFTAYKVNISSSECDKQDSTINSNLTKDETKLNAVLIGILGGLIFLVILAVLVYHQKCKSNNASITGKLIDRKKLLILYSNKSKTDTDLIAKLSKFIKSYFPQYEIVSDLDGIYSLTVKAWYQSEISQASVVLIVCPKNWKEEDGQVNKHTPIQPYFQSAWEYAVNFGNTNKRGYKWLFLLRFEFSNISEIPYGLRDRMIFKLPKEFDKFCVCLKDKSQKTCFGKLGTSTLRRQFKKDVCLLTQEPTPDSPKYERSFERFEPSDEITTPATVKSSDDIDITYIECPVHGTKIHLAPCPVHGVAQHSPTISHDHVFVKDIYQNNDFKTRKENYLSSAFSRNYTSSKGEGQFQDEQEPFIHHAVTNENSSAELYPHVLIDNVNEINDSPADDNSNNMDDLFYMLEKMNFENEF